MDDKAIVLSWPESKPHGAIDGHRQDKPIVVVGVFADQIDASGGTHDDIGLFAIPRTKSLCDLFSQIPDLSL